MIQLLHHPYAPGNGSVDILLDLSPSDISEMPDKLPGMFQDAEAAGRKVGSIVRQFGGDTYFTYDEATRAQLEISLISALALPKTDVNVTQNCRRQEQWER